MLNAGATFLRIDAFNTACTMGSVEYALSVPFVRTCRAAKHRQRLWNLRKGDSGSLAVFLLPSNMII
jgi:hypothetical protein